MKEWYEAPEVAAGPSWAIAEARLISTPSSNSDKSEGAQCLMVNIDLAIKLNQVFPSWDQVGPLYVILIIFNQS